MKHRRSLASLLFAFALVGAACGADATVETGAPESEVPSEEPAVGSDEPEEAATTLLSGAAFDLEDYAGQDLLVWFWAPW